MTGMQSLKGILDQPEFQAALELAKAALAERAANPAPAPALPSGPAHTLSDEDLTRIIEACPTCGGIGALARDVPLSDPAFGRLAPCPACQAYRDERQGRAAVRRYAPLFQRFSMLRGDLTHKTFQDYQRQDENTEAWRAVREWAWGITKRQQALPWLYLYGPVGNGKTHLAAAAANVLASYQVPVVFTTWPEALDMLYTEPIDSRPDLIKALQAVTVLIIDDIRLENLRTEYATSVLFQIVDRRYVTGAFTLFVSNHPLVAQPGARVPGLSDAEPRVASRIGDRSRCRVVLNLAPDHRTV